MLARPERLRLPRDINRVYARGRFGGGQDITVKVLPNHYGSSRAAVVVSRKISKQAVIRNRIRRRLSAQLAENWATVSLGYDIVVTVRSDISGLPVPRLQQALRAALEKAGVLQTKPRTK